MPATSTLADREPAQHVVAGPLLARAKQGGLTIELRGGERAVRLLVRRAGCGGLALEVPLFGTLRHVVPRSCEALGAWQIESDAGDVDLLLRGDSFGLEQLRLTVSITPRADLPITPAGRDLTIFNEAGQTQPTRGTVEAVQRKLNTGLCYFTCEWPELGKVLYLQNLTALNDYFAATGTKPENAVGGEWPELGYRLPVDPKRGTAVLPGGRKLTLFDTILVIRRYPEQAEDDSAWQFLDMLGAVYPWLSPPPAEHRDWIARAEATLADLSTAPEARIEHYGHRYFHPYTASEYPDVMTELSLASAAEGWSQWRGEPHPLVGDVLEGIHRFHRPELGALSRYLPNVGPDKNANEVDSWYLYHPLLKLADLALAGHNKAKRLFLASIDYGILSARHFEYKWPIKYDIRDFSVIQAVTEADQRGQTDVGGIYAWVMLQAFELTHERRFLDEAIAAVEAAKGMRFDLNYQANLTAWGAAACIRLWRITNNKQYLTQSYVYLASFIHNSQLWESEIGHARHFRNFLGATCLQDAPYMACYECYDAFAAFEKYLQLGGPDLIPSVRLLISEYCKHALSRAWSYYPDALPPEAIASENRNGYIGRQLSFPVEDLYPDGQEAGQVGQEIYGAGAALTFASRAFHPVEGAPFVLFCEYFLTASHRFDATTLSLSVDGQAGTECRLSLIPTEADADFAPRLRDFAGSDIAFERKDGRFDALVPSAGSLVLSWTQDDDNPKGIRK